jgi:hypothetical protein
MLLFYIAFAVVMLVPMLGVWFAVRGMPSARKSLILVGVATLLFTPSWGPATIVVVPVPFGILLFTTLLTRSWNDLPRWLCMFPVWHAVAFPATACGAYFIIQRLQSSRTKTGSSAAV